MTSISQKYAQQNGKPLFISDFSPPRGADISTVQQVKDVGADLVCVAYSPGKSVRVDSTVAAYLLQQRGQDAIFNLACRDMNKLAIQSHLLGAQLLGLENVLVLQGDAFTQADLATVKEVSDYRSVDLIRAIVALNQGVDFRGLKLRAPTSFCIGAAINLSASNLEHEAALARQKVEAGADFFLTQAFYEVGRAKQFLVHYRRLAGREFPKPVFYGLQVLEKDGLVFGDVPEATRRDLERGRPATEIALEQLNDYMENGLSGVYLIPPILRGGRRNYQAAREVVTAFRGQGGS
ncbi:MAG: methylenetetrahydrofolate reductase [Dehalococcoidia bacterium]|nr:methylenetetrahydrofolate reductase [Dehalococcoidia bacterium]